MGPCVFPDFDAIVGIWDAGLHSEKEVIGPNLSQRPYPYHPLGYVDSQREQINMIHSFLTSGIDLGA